MNKIHMGTLASHAQITDTENFRAGGVGVGLISTKVNICVQQNAWRFQSTNMDKWLSTVESTGYLTSKRARQGIEIVGPTIGLKLT